ncbi:cycloartenol-C-24-methyltransferase [Cinnamomum micranthum f. kanehirae]|uniref:Methyltransferase n=1 Tax=Cinnamomum micranthum f. kanehirae TaxID=337451 RepID=A0A443NGU6_9MAGN|nr:cycloartenol-C-24-methyltransferase [Cinnamomum micranthum f. kanehirae]
MAKTGALDLASGLGGKIDKKEVLSAVEQYEKYHVCGDQEERKANCTDMVNKYYDLATSFYEFGWGESFHFAHRWKGESLRESIKRHEHFFALQLSLKPGTKADFMKMPFADNSFDAIYAIEATCHAPDAVGCYKEIYRVLKPGQCFAADEWCLTDSFDPMNKDHQRIKAEIEIGDGLSDIRTTKQCLEALKLAGFEVVWEKDLAVDSPLPWYLPLDTSNFSLSSFRSTAVGRFITKNMVQVLEFLGLAPEGSQRVSSFLEKAADGLVEGGRSTCRIADR